ncbi:MAG: YceD family protein [Paracoccaceae bacterium]
MRPLPMTQTNPPAFADFRVADLSPRRDTRFLLEPDADMRAALAQQLGLLGLRKVRFGGVIRAEGRHGWRLEAKLGATVIQACIVSLVPVTTRLDLPVVRRFHPEAEAFEDGSETEMPEDDTLDILGTTISPAAVMAETLALALPDYPRAPDAGIGSTQHSAPGVAPMSDADAKPFAGLAALRDALSGDAPDQT